MNLTARSIQKKQQSLNLTTTLQTLDELDKEEAHIKNAKQDMVAVKTLDGTKFYCGNPGCSSKTFFLHENSPEACHHHSGEPIT